MAHTYALAMLALLAALVTSTSAQAVTFKTSRAVASCTGDCALLPEVSGNFVRVQIVASEPLPSAALLSIIITAQDGSTASDDFSTTQTAQVMAQGATTASVDFLIETADGPELDEQFVLTTTVTNIFWSGSFTPEPGHETVTVTVPANESPYGAIGIVDAGTALTVSEGDSVGVLFLQRIGGRFGEQSVSWDLTPANMGLSINAGNIITIAEDATQVAVSFTITDDSTPELEERFVFSLTNVTGGAKISSGGAGMREIVVRQSDAPLGRFSFEATSLAIGEEDGLVSLKILRSAGDLAAVDVLVRTAVADQLPAGVTVAAIAGTDYVALDKTTVSFAAGESSKAVTVSIIDNASPEGPKAFSVAVSVQTAGAEVGVPSTTTVIIAASDVASGEFQFAAAHLPNLTVEEPASGVKIVELTVERSRGDLGHVTLPVVATSTRTTPDVSGAVDWQLASPNVTFVTGQRSAVVQLLISADDVPELDQRIDIDLATPQGGYDGQTGLGAVTRVSVYVLANDNARGLFALAEADVPLVIDNEGDAGVQPVSVRVTRSGGALTDVTILWQLQYNEVGAEQDDFVAYNGSITFESGEHEASIALLLLGDIKPELPEQLTLTLTGTSGGAALLADVGTSRPLTLALSDSPFGVVSLAATTSLEEPSGIFTNVTVTFLRTPFLEGRILVDYEVTPGPADADSDAAAESLDYAAQLKTLIFEPGESTQTTAIFVLDDSIPERAERFTVTISGVRVSSSDPTLASGATISPTDNALTFTIAPNDDASGVIEIASAARMSALRVQEQAVVGAQNASKALAVPLLRSAGTFGDVRVGWELTGSAAANAQFVLAAGEALLADGETQVDVLIYAAADDVPELDATFTFRLTDISGGLSGQASLVADTAHREATVIIEENDDARGVFSFAETVPRNGRVTEAELGQPATMLSYDVQRLGGTLTSVDVFWELRLVGGCQLPGEPESLDCGPSGDFVATSGQLTFSPGQTRASVNLTIPRDGVPELDESFELALSLQPGLGRLENGGAVVAITITENEDPYGRLGFGASNDSSPEFTADETSGSNTTAIAIVQRMAGVFGDVTVAWELREVANNGASSGIDIAPKRGNVTLPAGQRTAPIQLTVFDDDIPELTERILIVLTTVSSAGLPAVISTGQAAASIVIPSNDDPHGRFSFAEAAIDAEEGAVITLEVQRVGGTTGVVRVPWSTRGGSAVGNSDFFTVVSEELTFVEGQRTAQLSVTLINDTQPELAEVFEIVMGAPYLFSGATGALPKLGSVVTSAVTILENDDARGVLSLTEAERTVEEISQQVVFTVSRTAGAFGTATAEFTVVDETATAGQDYTVDIGLTGTLTFPAGVRSRSVAITVLDDNTPERRESLRLVLSAAGGGARLGATVASRLVIAKNDDIHGVIGFNSDSLTEILNTFDEDHGSVTLTLTRTGGAVGRVSVDFIASTPTPRGGNLVPDVQPKNGTVVFTNGERTRTVTLTIVDENIPELQERIVVKLGNPTNGSRLRVGEDSAVLTLLANDEPLGVVEVRPNGAYSTVDAVTEERKVHFGVAREFGALGAITVTGRLRFTADDAFAPCSTDNVVPFGLLHTITLADGVTDGEAVIALPRNISLTPRSRFCFDLTQVARASGGVIQTATGASPRLGTSVALQFLVEETFLPGTVHLLNSSISVGEDDAPVVEVQFERRGGTYSRVVFAVTLEANDSSASAAIRGGLGPVNVSDADAIIEASQVVMPHGSGRATFTVVVRDDALPELAEILRFRVATALETGVGMIGSDSANRVITLTITESDDPYGRFSFQLAQQNVQRSLGLVQLDVTRRGQVGIVNVPWQIVSADSTALAGRDFERADVSGTLTFAPGTVTRTINIGLLSPNNISIPFRHFTVALGEPVNAAGPAVLGSIATTRVDLTACHSCTIGVTQAQITVSEATSGLREVRVPLLRTPFAYDNLQVRWQITGGSPEDDFAVTTGTLSMPIGTLEGEIVLQVLNDTAAELDEAYTLILSAVVVGETALDDDARSMRIVIRANDFPFGLLQFAAAEVELEETAVAGSALRNFNVTLERAPGSGTIGRVAVRVSAADNILSTAFTPGDDTRSGASISQLKTLTNVSAANCASACVAEEGCGAFEHRSATKECVLRSSAAVGPAKAGVVFYARRANADLRALAVEEVDFAALSTTVVFAQGQRRANVLVSVLSDKVSEVAESFQLRLSELRLLGEGDEIPAANALGFGRSEISAVIRANGLPGGRVGFSSLTTVIAEEGGERPRFVVTRDGSAFGALTVSWSATLTAGSAGAPSTGLAAVSGTVLLADLARSAEFSLEVLDDDVPELSQTYRIELTAVTAPDGIAAALNTSRAAVSLRVEPSDNAFGLVRLAPSEPLTVRLREPASESAEDGEKVNSQSVNSDVASAVNITVQRLFGQFQRTVVGWTLEPAAAASLVFVHSSGNVTFEKQDGGNGSNVSEQRLEEAFSLHVRADTTPELQQTFNLTLRVLQGNATLEEQPLSVVVLGSDFPYGQVGFESPTLRVVESSGSTTVAVQRAFGRRDNITVAYSILSGKATDADVVLRNGTIMFAASEDGKGATPTSDIALDIINDAEVEEDEWFQVRLTVVSGRAALGHSVLNVTIGASDDGREYGIVAPAANVVVRESAKRSNLTLVRRGGTAGALNVTYSITAITYLELLYRAPSIDMRFSAETANVRTGLSPEACASACNAMSDCIAFDHTASGPAVCTFRSNVTLAAPEAAVGYTIYLRASVPAAAVGAIPAAAGTDFDAVPVGHVEFADGQTEAVIYVRVNADGEREEPEAFRVEVLSVSSVRAQPATPGAEVGEPAAQAVFVASSDDVHGVFAFATATPPDVGDVSEGNAVSGLTIRRSGGSRGSVRLPWTVVRVADNGDLLAAEADVSPSSGILTFDAGVVALTLPVLTMMNDITPELQERFRVRLGDPSVADLSPALSSVRLDENATLAVAFSIPENDAAAGELGFGEEPRLGTLQLEEGGRVSVPVTRTRGLLKAVAVSWSIVLPLPKGVTVTPLGGTLLFDVGQAEASFELRAADDTLPTVESAVILRLGTNVTNGGVLRGGSEVGAIVVLANDDGFALADAGQTLVLEEDAREAEKHMRSLVVRRLHSNVHTAVTLTWALEGTPAAVAQFERSQGEVLFAPDDVARSFLVALVDDDVPELSGSVTVRLAATSGAARVAAANASLTLQYRSSDSAFGVFQFSRPLYTVVESPTFVPDVALVRTGGTFSAVNVIVATAAHSSASPNAVATADIDYLAADRISVQFAAGQRSATLQTAILDDDVPESDEHYLLRVLEVVPDADGPFDSNLDTSPEGVGAEATITIKANDDANGVLEVDANSIVLTEGQRSTELVVSRSRGAFGSVSIDYHLLGASAQVAEENTALTPLRTTHAIASRRAERWAGFVAGGTQYYVYGSSNGPTSVYSVDVDSDELQLTQVLSTSVVLDLAVVTLPAHADAPQDPAPHVYLLLPVALNPAAPNSRGTRTFVYRFDTEQARFNQITGFSVYQAAAIAVTAVSPTTLHVVLGNAAQPAADRPSLQVVRLRINNDGSASVTLLQLVALGTPLNSVTLVASDNGKEGTPGSITSPLLLGARLRTTALIWAYDSEAQAYAELVLPSTPPALHSNVQRFTLVGTDSGHVLVAASRLGAARPDGGSAILRWLPEEPGLEAAFHIPLDNVVDTCGTEQDGTAWFAAVTASGDVALAWLSRETGTWATQMAWNVAGGGNVLCQPQAAGAGAPHVLVGGRNVGATSELNSFVLPPRADLALVAANASSTSVPPSGTLVFADGQRRASVRVVVPEDNLSEGAFLATFALSNVTGGARLGSAVNTSVSVRANDALLGSFRFSRSTLLTNQTYTEPEGPAGSTALAVALHVEREGAAGRSAVLRWATSAASRAALEKTEGTLTFAAGQLSAVLTLLVPPDEIPELQESFAVQLLPPLTGGATVLPTGQVDLTLLGSDAPLGGIGFSSGSRVVSVAEGSAVVLTVLRARDSFGPFNVSYVVSAASAASVALGADPVADFGAISGVLQFEDGRAAVQTRDIVLSAKADGVPEVAEAFVVTLSHVSAFDGSSPPFLPEADSSTVTLLASDVPFGKLHAPAELAVSASTFPLERALTVTVVRQAGSFGTLSADVEVTFASPGSNVYETRPDLVGPDAPEAVTLSAGMTEFELHIPLTLAQTLLEGSRVRVALVRGQVLPPGFNASLVSYADAELVLEAEIPVEVADGLVQVMVDDRTHVVLEPQDGSPPTAVSVRLERLGGSFGSVPLRWTVARTDNAAGPASDDLLITSGSVVFSAGQVAATVNLGVLPDDVPEADEKYLFAVELAPGYVGGANIATGGADVSSLTVVANDEPIGVLEVVGLSLRSVANAAAAYDRGLEVTLARTGGLIGRLRVTIQAAYASDGSDPFQPDSVSSDPLELYDATTEVAVAADQSTTVIAIALPASLVLRVDGVLAVRVLAVALETPAETLSQHTNLTAHLGSSTSAATVVATDVHTYGRVSLAAALSGGGVGARVASEAEGQLTFRIVRDVANRGSLTVTWAAISGTAVAGTDFENTASNVVTLADGETAATIVVNLLDDALPEASEDFVVILQSVTGGGEVGPAARVDVTIAPSDLASGRFAFAAAARLLEVSEPASGSRRTMRLRVERSAGSFGTVQVPWIASGPGAADIVPTTGLLSFADGDTARDVVFDIIGDEQPEIAEAINVTLSTPTGGLPLQSALATDGTAAARVVIQRNNAPYGRLQLLTSGDQGVVVGIASSGRFVETTLSRGSGGTFGQLAVTLALTGLNGSSAAGAGLPACNSATPLAVTDCSTVFMLGPGVQAISLRLFVSDEVALVAGASVSVTLTQARLVGDASAVVDVVASSSLLEFDVPLRAADGAVGFTSGALAVQEPDPATAPARIVLEVMRSGGTYVPGSLGLLVVAWQATGEHTKELVTSTGTVTFSQGQTKALLTLELISDTVPEITEIIGVRLGNFTTCTALDGDGTCIGARSSAAVPASVGGPGMDLFPTVDITVAANDDPNGVIQFSTDSAAVLVAGDATRVILTVTRDFGTFGAVRASYRALQAQYDTYPVDERGSVTFAAEQDSAEIILPLRTVHRGASVANFTVLLFADAVDLQGAKLGVRTLASVTVRPVTSRAVVDNVAGVGGSSSGGDSCTLYLPEDCLGLNNAAQAAVVDDASISTCLTDIVATLGRASVRLCRSSVSFVEDVLANVLALRANGRVAAFLPALGASVNLVAQQSAGTPRLESLLELHAVALLSDCDPAVDGRPGCTCCCTRTATYSHLIVRAEAQPSTALQGSTWTLGDSGTSLQWPLDLSASSGLPTAGCVQARSSLVGAADQTFDTGTDTRIVGNVALEAGISNVTVRNLAMGAGAVYRIRKSSGAREPRDPRCVFWDPTRARWSGEGCRLTEFDGTTAACECSHFTLFAVEEQQPSAVSFHIYATLTIAVVATILLLGIMVGAGPLLQDYGVRTHLLAALLLALFALLVNVVVTRDKESGVVALFGVGLALHYTVLVLMSAVTAAVVRYYQLSTLSVVLGEDASCLKFGMAMVWVLPAFVVALYIAVGYDASGLSTEEIYGDVFDNGRVAFASHRGMVVGGFLVEMALLLALCLGLVLLRLRQSFKSADRQFTVDENDLLLTMEARRVHTLSAGIWATMVIGAVAVYLDYSGLEILFSLVLIALSVGMVVYAYRLRRQGAQIADGTWDPWAGGDGERPPKALSSDKAERDAYGAGSGAAHGSETSTFLPMTGSTSGRQGVFNGVYDLPPVERSQNGLQQMQGAGMLFPPTGDGGYINVSADLSLNSGPRSPAVGAWEAPLPGSATRSHLSPPAAPESKFGSFGGAMALPSGDADEEVEFDDLLYALQAGGVNLSGMDEGDLGYGAPTLSRNTRAEPESPSFDMRRISIADTHL